jgi:hypothetical protein
MSQGSSEAITDVMRRQKPAAESRRILRNSRLQR